MSGSSLDMSWTWAALWGWPSPHRAWRTHHILATGMLWRGERCGERRVTQWHQGKSPIGRERRHLVTRRTKLGHEYGSLRRWYGEKKWAGR